MSTGQSLSPTQLFDPDTLARLEGERDFLLRSLSDLERERAAGDVDEHDYATLKDDYTARAAAVLRSIEQRRTARRDATKRVSLARRMGWILTVVVVAAVAGLLIARFSGARRDGEVASGDTITTTRDLIAAAEQAAVDGNFDQSVDLYSDALDLSPTNVEAFTYRGWSKVRLGDLDAAAVDLDAAIDLDPTYPDARVFRASVYVSKDDFIGADEQLNVFDTLDAPDLMNQIVSSQRLRERVALGLVTPLLLGDEAVSLADSGLDSATVVLAASQLDVEQRVDEELQLFAAVLAEEPDNLAALSGQGWVFARLGVDQGSTALLDRALAQFDQALSLDPQAPDALVYRSFTQLFGFEKADAAKADLDAFEALADPPATLVSLVAEYGLRAAIEDALGG